jgi:DinB superfamily
MKKVLLLISTLLFGISIFAQSLTPADREKGAKYLEQTRDGVVAAVKGLSDAQMKFKAAPDRWSVAETLEHIALAENDAHNLFAQAMKSPAEKADRDAAKVDATILSMVPDRSHKAQAPPQLVPTGRWTPSESLDHFLKSRAEAIALMKSTPDLREHLADSPFGQKWDAYEFLLFGAAHSERHTKQINEVKADPNFPKN